MSRLVWLPFDAAELGDPPSALRYETVDPTERVPDSVAEVAFYVPPYAVGPGVADVVVVAALESGRITAALDVTDPEPLPSDSPLWSAPGLLVSPHVGGASSAMWPRAHRLVRDQLHRWAAGEPLANVITGDY